MLAAHPPGDCDVDPDRLAELAGLLDSAGRSMLPKLIEAYLQTAESSVADLRAAGEAGNTEGIRGAAHRMLGSSLSFGIIGVARVARILDEEARTGSTEGSLTLIGRLEAAVAMLRATLLLTAEERAS